MTETAVGRFGQQIVFSLVLVHACSKRLGLDDLLASFYISIILRIELIIFTSSQLML